MGRIINRTRLFGKVSYKKTEMDKQELMEELKDAVERFIKSKYTNEEYMHYRTTILSYCLSNHNNNTDKNEQGKIIYDWLSQEMPVLDMERIGNNLMIDNLKRFMIDDYGDVVVYNYDKKNFPVSFLPDTERNMYYDIIGQRTRSSEDFACEILNVYDDRFENCFIYSAFGIVMDILIDLLAPDYNGIGSTDLIKMFK